VPELRRLGAELPSLEALVGEPRAALLRALHEPSTVGELATQLELVPSSVTHHLRTLEPAGLVLRRRRGQSVFVHRTRRGTLLLSLYPAPPWHPLPGDADGERAAQTT
jgi:DNA-binding transcriptional ArsR family regulator